MMGRQSYSEPMAGRLIPAIVIALGLRTV